MILHPSECPNTPSCVHGVLLPYPVGIVVAVVATALTEDVIKDTYACYGMSWWRATTCHAYLILPRIYEYVVVMAVL